jgi:hypothetical protein
MRRKNGQISKNHTIVAVGLLTIFTLIFSSGSVGGMNSGDGSQYALTQAISDDYSVSIDKHMQWTYWIDYAKKNNHYYLDREPGISILAVPFYVLAKRVASYALYPYNGYHSSVTDESKIQAFTYFSTAFLSAIGISCAFLLFTQMGYSPFLSTISTILMGVGTLYWKYASSFYREPVYTSILILCLLCLILYAKNTKRYSLVILCGGLSGLSILIDYSKFYVIPLLYIYLHSLRDNSKKRIFVSFVQGIAPFLIIIMFYNTIVFGSPLTNPHLHKEYFTWMQNVHNLFQAPLLASVITNLFSTQPLSSSLMKFFSYYPFIARQMGVSYAMSYRYFGIFSQSPILYLAGIGWIFLIKLKRKFAFLVLGTTLLMFLMMAKFTIFWATNSYDTRYFIPVSILLLIGLPEYFAIFRRIKHRPVQYALILITILSMIVSIYNAWFSHVTNFGPNVSGEHRLDYFSMSPISLLSYLFSGRFSSFIFFTFPNIVNLPLMAIFFLPIPLFFLIRTLFTQLINPVQKHLI